MATQFVCPNRTPNMGVDYDIPSQHGKTLDEEQNSAFTAEFSAAQASGTVTITVAGAQNDVFRTTINGINTDVTVGATPTTSTVASQVAAAINANASLADLVVATVASAVVTITAAKAGLGGNGITLAVSTVSGTVAGTASGTTLTGGTQYITPLDNFVVVVGRMTLALRSGRPILATSDIATAIINSGYPYQ